MWASYISANAWRSPCRKRPQSEEWEATTRKPDLWAFPVFISILVDLLKLVNYFDKYKYILVQDMSGEIYH